MSAAAQRFLQFADFLPEALLLVTSSGTIRATNRKALESVFGGNQVAGQTLTDLVEDPAAHVSDYLRMCARSRSPLPGALRWPAGADGVTGGHFRCEGWTLNADGDTGLVLLRLTPGRTAISRFRALNQRVEALTKEISLRMKAEQSAHEQREMWRVMLLSIGDAVITTDTEGRISFMNPVAEAHTGWTLQDALGRSLDDVFVICNEDTREPVESPVRKVLRTGHVVGLANHTVLIRKNATELPIDDSGAPIMDASGRVSGVVLVFHEISERRTLERELRRQADALRQADRRKDEFLAMLAHELRNPLAPLQHCVQLLRARERNPVSIDLLTDMMGRQTGQLIRLVDDLLDISRITRGMIRLKKTSTSLSAIMRHAIETVQSAIEQREHRLQVNLPPETVAVNGDLARLSQVLCNLLTNAAKFMDPGGLITVSGHTEGKHAVMRVRDHGAGLGEELLPHVFDLFSQGDRGLDRSHGGLGIGLTLVKTLITLHDGEVSASSEGLGKGSEFTVRLPLASPVSPPLKQKPSAGPQLPRRVLIVDDNVDAAQTLAMLLNTSGCEVQYVHEGPSAIRVARSDAPDAILLDIGLPGMDGYEVARRMRRLPGPHRPLIVAVTGYGSDMDRERSREAGFDHHLAKPVDLDALLDLLK